MQQAIEALPEKLKMTFTLVQVQELKYKDVAEILDIPVGTVKSRVADAERRLREALKERMPE